VAVGELEDKTQRERKAKQAVMYELMAGVGRVNSQHPAARNDDIRGTHDD